MKKFACYAILVLFLCAVHPAALSAKPLDGIQLEGVQTLNRGAWDFKTALEFASGAEPGNVAVGATTVKIKVDSVRLPFEFRRGITDNIEVGGDFGFESDDGTTVTAGGTTITLLDGSGIQRFRILGKWNFYNDLAGIADLAFLGKNELYYSLDSFDFGLKFIYGPQVGPGNLNLNLGFLIKGGDPDLDGGTNITGESYNNIFSYGVGYIYPWTDRFTGIVEMAGGSAIFKGGKSMLGFNFGGRYGFTDRFLLEGALGLGLGGGSPNFLLRVGLNIMGGALEEYSSAAPTKTEPASRWTPTTAPSGQKTTTQAAPATTPTTTPSGPYIEPPTRYDTPKPPAPTPSGPSLEEQLAQKVADASAAFNRGDYVSASVNYEAAIRLKDNDPVLHYNLATAYFQLKRYPEAKTYYKNAVTYNPADPDSHLYLGYTYYYLQDQAGAIREWQKVLEIDPSNQLARDNLKSLGVE